MADRRHALQATMGLLQRHYGKFLGFLGVGAGIDLVKEYARGKVMDWALSNLGSFGTWLFADTFSVLSLFAIMSVVFCAAVFTYYDVNEHHSILVETERFVPPRFIPKSRRIALCVLAVIVVAMVFGWYKYYAFMNNPDHARLEILGIKRIPQGASSGVAYPIYRVFYAVKGKQAEVGFLSREMVMTSDQPLTESQLKHQYGILYDLPAEEKAVLYADKNEIYPDAHHVKFISVPEGPGGIADTLNAESDDVAAGKKYLYLLTALFYRDRVMPARTHAITMNCARFHGSLDLYDDCGNRIFLESRP